VQLLDNLLGRYTYSAHKQLGLFLDDDINQLVQVALGVVIVGLAGSGSKGGEEKVDAEC
jgi:hypothetical protein